MKRRTLVSLAAALAMAPAAWAAPNAKPAARDRKAARPTARTAIGRIRTAGVLKVGVVQQFPWAMLDAQGKWSGFDIDVCTRLATDLGVRAEFVDATWDQSADDVLQGVVDIAASLWPTPRRALVVNFTRAYGTTQTALVASRQKSAGLNTLDAFNQSSIVIGVRAGSEGERVARALLGRAQLRTVKDETEALHGLESGELHAMVAVTPLPEILAARAPASLTMPIAPLRRRSEAFAVRVDEFDLLAYLNTWIGFGEETGWLEERRTYWFGGKAGG